MSFNLNKLTVKAQEVVQNAIEIAQNYNNQLVEPEHIFASMLQEAGSVAESMVQKTGANVAQLKVKVGEFLESLPKVSGAGIGNQALSQNTAKLFDKAANEAKNLKDEFVSTE
ncbi:MAG: type VI secretion system ATPase TssH, partial [Erysipelotrichaceae bacterium]|nr:type VI secretion system ATPase TssH [Erysipelotrichaceae bacterium]